MKTMKEEDKKNYHPKTLEKLLMPDGSFRYPHHDEWNEDYGLGYLDRMAKLGKIDENGNIIDKR